MNYRFEYSDRREHRAPSRPLTPRPRALPFSVLSARHGREHRTCAEHDIEPRALPFLLPEMPFSGMPSSGFWWRR